MIQLKQPELNIPKVELILNTIFKFYVIGSLSKNINLYNTNSYKMLQNSNGTPVYSFFYKKRSPA